MYALGEHDPGSAQDGKKREIYRASQTITINNNNNDNNNNDSDKRNNTHNDKNRFHRLRSKLHVMCHNVRGIFNLNCI